MRTVLGRSVPGLTGDAMNGSFCGRTRREFLWETGAGFTGVALAALLDRDGFFSQSALARTTGRSLERPMSPLASHFPAKAKRCIFLFMYGGPSQMDLFDYKPELQKRHGQTVNVEVRLGHDRKTDADGLEAQISQAR